MYQVTIRYEKKGYMLEITDGEKVDKVHFDHYEDLSYPLNRALTFFDPEHVNSYERRQQLIDIDQEG